MKEKSILLTDAEHSLILESLNESWNNIYNKFNNHNNPYNSNKLGDIEFILLDQRRTLLYNLIVKLEKND